MADLGTWDTWVSASRRNEAGDPLPGRPAFAAEHYELDVTLAKKDLRLLGSARIHLRSVSGLGRIVHLRANSDLEVSKVALPDGEELFFHRSGEDLLVPLPSAPDKDSITVIEVHYHGHMVEKFAGRTYFLRDTINWYPHAGELELATYDVTLHWPQRLQLVASGRPVEEGLGPRGMKWQRRKLDHPSFAFSFEVGRFRTLTRQAGHVEISLALDLEARPLLEDDQDRLLQTLADALTFYEETFGPYPLDHLVAVTTPRQFSQSLLGFVTLSTLMMLDEGGVMSLFFGFEDPRTVIAHEVAHQWWGHIVGMGSYREQWISESMATYSAILFARKKLWAEARSLVGPTSGWQYELTCQTTTGRTIESLGPLTLGPRLISSHSSSAYDSIVYKKGAVVIDMLSRFYGEETFLRLLRSTARHVSFKPVSTEQFLGLLGQLSGTDLTAFANQFIYGTGLPEIYYDYRFQPDGEGWKIHLSVRQQSPVHFSYSIVEKDGRPWDVVRRAKTRLDTDLSSLAVPIRIVAFDPERVPVTNSGRKGDERGSLRAGNVTFQTHRLVQGESTSFELPLQLEPRDVILDPDHEVFGRFFNETRNPKRVLLLRGLDRAALEDYTGAERLFQQALAAEVSPLETEPSKVRREALDFEREILDALILLSAARLALDTDRLQQARQLLDQAEQLVQRESSRFLEGRLRALQGRRALLAGEAEEAFRILQRTFLKRGRLSGSAEASLLLGIVALRTDREKELRSALQRAQELGADVTGLSPDS